MSRDPLRAVFVLFALLGPAAAQGAVKGDVRTDGFIDTRDAVLVGRYVAGQASLEPEQLDAADLAPVSGSVSQPDGVVDVRDLVVLMRIVSGHLGPDAPVLDPLGSGNPLASVSGSCEPTAAITLFVSNVPPEGEDPITVPVGTGSEDDCDGAFTITNVPLLFDGTNRMHAIAHVGGLPSRASEAVESTYVNSFPHQINQSLTITNETQVWTPGEGGTPDVPYEVSALVTVGSGGQLILAPGAVLRFALNVSLTIQQGGTLTILGAPGRLVTLTTNDANWEGIVIQPGSTGSLIRYARIEKGKNSGVFLNGAAPGCCDLDATITDSEIFVTSGRGIWAEGPGEPRVTILRNLIEGPGSQFVGIALVRAGASRIEHNVIHKLSVGVEDNTSAATVEILNNDIVDSVFGLKLQQSRGDIRNNKITGNSTGIILFSNFDFGNPGIHDNHFSNTTNLSVTQFGADVTIDAEGNYWGSIDPGEIETKIVHQLDGLDPIPPLVDFAPFRTSEGGPLDHGFLLGTLHDSLTTLVAGQTYEGVGPLLVRPGKSATIPAGTTLLMNQPDAELVPRYAVEVDGALHVAGTSASPVLFRSVVPDTPSPGPMPGDWQGIVVAASGTGTQIDWAVIEHATRGVDITGAAVTVSNSEVRAFSEAGISIADAEGTLDSNLIEGSDGTGIELTDATTDLTRNTIQNTKAGIYVTGGLSTPSIGVLGDPMQGNIVTANTWGIWLQGNGAPGGNPAPAIHRNDVFGNTLVLDVNDPPPANVRISDFAGATVIDAIENYWGATSQAAIAGTVLLDEIENPATIDISDFLDARIGSGGVPIGGSPVFTSLFSGVSRDREVITPTIGGPEASVNLTFTSAADASVELRIREEVDGGAVVRTENVSVLAGQEETVQWEGIDDSDDFLPDEAYVFELEATVNSITYTYAPPRSTDAIDTNQGEGATHYTHLPGIGTEVEPGEFNIYQNKFMKLLWRLRKFPMRVTLKVHSVEAPIPPAGTGGCTDQVDPMGENLAFPVFEDVPMLEDEDDLNGFRISVFDGRKPTGEIGISPGPIDYCMPVPTRLKPNFILVERTTPAIRGPEYVTPTPTVPDTPNVEVKSDPYLVRHSYEQVTQIEYCVDQDAVVTTRILKPGTSDHNDPLNIAAVLETDEARTAISDCDQMGSTGYTLEWDGHAGGGARMIDSDVDGSYTFVIEAENALQPDLVSLYRGIIQVRQ